MFTHHYMRTQPLLARKPVQKSHPQTATTAKASSDTLCTRPDTYSVDPVRHIS